MRNKAYQKGVAIVYAVLLMAGIMAASLAIAGLIVRELRITQDIAQSIKAYYGAETGVEYALAEYKRIGSVPAEGGTVGDVDWEIEPLSDNDNFPFSLPWETTKEIPLYDVRDGSYFLGNPGTPVDQLRFSWEESPESPQWLEITLLSWEKEGNNIVLSPDLSTAKVQKKIVDVRGNSNKFYILDLTDAGEGWWHGDDYLQLLRFKHVNQGGPAHAEAVQFNVTAFGSGFGLPLNQETAFRVQGSAKGGADEIRRSLEIDLPLKPAAYNVYDYVLFSENEIDKTTSTDYNGGASATPTPTSTPFPSIVTVTSPVVTKIPVTAIPTVTLVTPTKP